MDYELTTLPNGLRVIVERMPSIRSVAVGCWVNTGSRDETPAEAGASHFLEHLLFKGTETWQARRISETFDGIGARHNAFTSKEYTCFWTRTRDADIDIGLEILSEMLQRPAFRSEEIDSERNVVLEEINMNEDDPTDVAHEHFMEALWDGHPIAPPILGTPASITGMERDVIAGYWQRRYTPTSVVVAIAGNVPDDIVERVAARFAGWSGTATGRVAIPTTPTARVAVSRRDTEQAHLVIGSPAIDRADDRRFALTLADHVLGGGMSSRLFREIRETRGLAYAVHSFRMPFLDSGATAIYVGTTPTHTADVLAIVRSQLDEIMTSGIDEEELDRAKGHVQGALALGLEDANSRMNRLGRNEITGLEHLSVDATLERIDAVTNDDIIDVAKAAYGGPYVLGAVGPFESEDLMEFVE